MSALPPIDQYVAQRIISFIPFRSELEGARLVFSNAMPPLAHAIQERLKPDQIWLMYQAGEIFDPNFEGQEVWKRPLCFTSSLDDLITQYRSSKISPHIDGWMLGDLCPTDDLANNQSIKDQILADLSQGKTGHYHHGTYQRGLYDVNTETHLFQLYLNDPTCQKLYVIFKSDRLYNERIAACLETPEAIIRKFGPLIGDDVANLIPMEEIWDESLLVTGKDGRTWYKTYIFHRSHEGKLHGRQHRDGEFAWCGVTGEEEPPLSKF